MGPTPPTLVGEVQSVSGSTVSVHLRAGLSSLALVGGESYRVGQVGAFLRVPLGYSHLYGVCSQVGAAALPHAIVGQGEGEIDGRWLTLTLFGECLGGEFQRGVSQYPTFGDEVHLVTNDEIGQIYRSPGIQVPLVIGTIASASGIEARIDLAKLVTRHSVVVGSSGAGKSNLVGVLLEAIATQGFGAARVLVLDPHGEYASAVGDNGKVFSIKPENADQEPLYVPFWALPFDELMQTTLGDLNTSQDGAIREEVVALKRSTAAHLSVPPPVEAITADSPIPFSARRLWFDLDDFETRTYHDNAKTQIEPPTTVGDAEALRPNINPHQALGGGSPFQGPRRGLTRGLESAIERRQDTRGDRFRMTVDGVPHGKRADAGDHLHRLVSSLVKGPSSRSEDAPVGHLAGFDVHAGVDRRFDEVSVTIPQAGAEIRFPTNEWRAVDPSSLVQRLERRIQNLDSSLTEARSDQTTSGQEAERARARIGAPFEHESSLRGLQRRQQEITEQLVPPAKEPPSVSPELTDAQRMAARLASQELAAPSGLRR